MRGCALALCNAISADGEASPSEVAWVQGHLSCKGFGSLTDEVADVAKAAEGKSLDQVVADTKASLQIGTLRFAGKAIVCDSLRASTTDGLDAKEEVAIKAVAAALSVEDFDQLKELSVEEEAHRAKKVNLVVPGHPNVAAKRQ